MRKEKLLFLSNIIQDIIQRKDTRVTAAEERIRTEKRGEEKERKNLVERPEPLYSTSIE